TSTGRLAVSQSTARQAPRRAVLRGFRGGRRPSRRVLRPDGHPSEWQPCGASARACYLRLQHAGSGGPKTGRCCGRDLAEGPQPMERRTSAPLGRMPPDRDIVPAQLVGSYVGAAPHPGGCRAKPGSPSGSRPNPAAGGLATSATLLPPAGSLLLLDVDLLFADLLGHPLLAGHGVLFQPPALFWHDPLFDPRLLLAEDHLVLGLRELRAGGGGRKVGVGDRLPLQAHPLPLDRDGLLDLLGGHVLAQPDPAPLPLAGADPQLFFRAGHGL